MIAYVLFIAILNLWLGFFLGQQVLQRRQLGVRVNVVPGDGRSAFDTMPSMIADVESATAGQLAVATASTRDEPNDIHREETSSDLLASTTTATTDKQDSPDAKRESRRWAAPKSWSDFGLQLQTIKERARYVRGADDRRLARECAHQLRDCARAWCSQLEKCLDESEVALRDELLADGADATTLEMCVAQLETSLTNIEALDWTAPVADLLDAVEREIHLLNENRRLVSPRTAR